MASTRNRDWIIGVLLALAALAAHGSDIGHGFTGLDDPIVVVQNAEVRRGMTWHGALRAFTDVGQGVNYWTPLARLSHMADVEAFGLEAWGHHLTNVLLHAANAALLFLALRRLTGAVWRPAFVGLLLAVNPVHVESVAWIAERRDVLGLFFGCLALWAYARYAAGPGAWRYALVFLAAAAAILSKPTMVTLPCVLWLLDFWPLRRWGWGSRPPSGRSAAVLIVEKLPLLAVTALGAAMTLVGHRLVMVDLESLPVWLRLLEAVRAYGGYFTMLAWPVNLLILYTDRYLWSMAAVAVPAGLLALMTYASIRTARTRPYLLVGWLWFLGTMAPMIGLFQAGAQVYAARFAYFPFIGLYIALVWGLGDILGAAFKPGTARSLASVAAACVAGAGIAGSWAQSRMWASDISLFSPVVRAGSESATAYNILAAGLEKAGLHNEAIKYNQRAAALDINDPRPILWLCWYALNNNNPVLAERLAKLAQRSGDTSPNGWSLLGRATLMEGRPQDAVRYFQAALKLGSTEPADWDNLGKAYEASGDFEAEVGAYDHWTRIDPGSWYAWDKLGAALMKAGRRRDAAAAFENALRIEPGNPNSTAHLREAQEGPGASAATRAVSPAPRGPMD